MWTKGPYALMQLFRSQGGVLGEIKLKSIFAIKKTMERSSSTES